MIFHSDGNSFYASCEQIYRPDLRGRPVAVLSNNDGIVVALNKEAKAFGLKRGDVYYKIRDLCRRNDITVFSSNYSLYADISRRITSVYLEFAPQVEEYSIDECFLFFDNCSFDRGSYCDMGTELRLKILHEIGVPVCIGGAPTKTLAKLYNKKAKEHDGVFIYDKNSVDRLLESTSCGTIWGIGPGGEKLLHGLGIFNALQLKHFPLDSARKYLTVRGFAIVQELNGIRCLDKVDCEARNMITFSRQFSHSVYELAVMECAAAQYAGYAVERLIKQGSLCRCVNIHISTCNFHDDAKLQYSSGTCVELSEYSCYTADIVEAAHRGLRRIFRNGYGYRTVMITLCKLCQIDENVTLFGESREEQKKKTFMKSAGFIKSQYGRESLKLAVELTHTGWETKREFLSPCWTTRISDIPRVV